MHRIAITEAAIAIAAALLWLHNATVVLGA